MDKIFDNLKTARNLTQNGHPEHLSVINSLKRAYEETYVLLKQIIPKEQHDLIDALNGIREIEYMLHEKDGQVRASEILSKIDSLIKKLKEVKKLEKIERKMV